MIPVPVDSAVSLDVAAIALRTWPADFSVRLWPLVLVRPDVGPPTLFQSKCTGSNPPEGGFGALTGTAGVFGFGDGFVVGGGVVGLVVDFAGGGVGVAAFVGCGVTVGVGFVCAGGVVGFVVALPVVE